MSKPFFCCSEKHRARALLGTKAHPHHDGPGGTATYPENVAWKCPCCAEAERVEDEKGATRQGVRLGRAMDAQAAARRKRGRTGEQGARRQADAMARVARGG